MENNLKLLKSTWRTRQSRIADFDPGPCTVVRKSN